MVGCLAAVLLAAAAPGAGSARSVARDPKAAAYCAARQDTVYQVAAYVGAVHSASSRLAKTRSRADESKLVTVADQGANWIDVHLGRLDPVDSGGSLGSAERDVLTGGTGLRDALGTLVDYLRAPSASKSALFLRQYAAAAARWNHAVAVIWRLGKKTPPPVVPLSL